MSTEVIITPNSASLRAQAAELWAARELLGYFVKRAIDGRYRPTTLGRSWIVLRPAIEVLTYVIVFGYFLKIRPMEVPYPAFLVCGLTPWLLFSQVVTGSSTSLAGALGIMSKVHFPRLIVPLTNLVTALLDFVAIFPIVFALLLIYQVYPGLSLLALPGFLIILLALAFGTSLIAASSAVFRPDVTIFVPLSLRLLMYLSPVVYPSSRVPDHIRPIYDLNPVATIIQGIRWSLGAAPAPGIPYIVGTILVTMLVLILGIRSFMRTEQKLVDFL